MADKNRNWGSIAKAYTTVYAVCYIVSPILGLHLYQIDPVISTAVLITIGLGLLSCLYMKNEVVVLILCAFEAVGCVGHFLKIIPWIPVFSDTAYITMSLLDLGQAIILFLLLETHARDAHM
jgi:hypothetical protein